MADEPKKRGHPKGSGKKRGIGDNGPSEDDIRIAVNELLDMKEEVRLISEKLKKKRNGLKQSGFVMHILDRQIKMLGLTPKEQKAEFETDVRYGKALNQPVGDLLDLFDEREGGDDPDHEERYVYNRGKQAGLSGQGWPDEPPEGTPPEFSKAWADGHEAGSEEVRAAFKRRQDSMPLPPPPAKGIEADEPDAPDEPTEEETEFAEVGEETAEEPEFAEID